MPRGKVAILVALLLRAAGGSSAAQPVPPPAEQISGRSAGRPSMPLISLSAPTPPCVRLTPRCSPLDPRRGQGARDRGGPVGSAGVVPAAQPLRLRGGPPRLRARSLPRAHCHTGARVRRAMNHGPFGHGAGRCSTKATCRVRVCSGPVGFNRERKESMMSRLVSTALSSTLGLALLAWAAPSGAEPVPWTTFADDVDTTITRLVAEIELFRFRDEQWRSSSRLPIRKASPRSAPASRPTRQSSLGSYRRSCLCWMKRLERRPSGERCPAVGSDVRLRHAFRRDGRRREGRPCIFLRPCGRG